MPCLITASTLQVKNSVKHLPGSCCLYSFPLVFPFIAHTIDGGDKDITKLRKAKLTFDMRTKQDLTARLLVIMVLLAGLQPAVAQPTILSTVPSNGATSVSPGAPVVFTFSAAMDPTATTAAFFDVTASFQSPPVIPGWSAGNTVLTCTPYPAFANNHTIQWQVTGQDPMGDPLTGTTTGSFTTVAGVGGGSGANALTSFLIGEYTSYDQASAGPPVLYPHITYELFAQTLLSSNRTATNITVTVPVRSAVSNLVETLLTPEKFSLVVYNTNLAAFNTNFPAGNYIFNVSAMASNQQVTVNLPAYTPPNAPQVINYNAAQSVNPSQPFTLNWNTFTNGGSADWIFLEMGGNPVPIFQTPLYGQPNALNGTATSVTIPAGTLPANSTNHPFLAFYHIVLSTNNGVISEAFVGSATLFTLITTATGARPLLNISRSGTNVLVEWPTNATGFTLESSTNLASAVWSSNLPAPVVVNTNQVVTNGISGTQKYYRLIQ